jgi:hypothetical protein
VPVAPLLDHERHALAQPQQHQLVPVEPAIQQPRSLLPGRLVDLQDVPENLGIFAGRRAGVGQQRFQDQREHDHAALTFKEPRVEIITYDEILEWQSLRIARELEWIRKVT